MDNTTLIKRLKSSDKQAFKYVYEQYYNSLCRFAFIMIKSKTTAEDIVQSTLISIWEKRNKLDESQKLRPYLFKTVKNRTLNYLKTNKVRITAEQRYATLPGETSEKFNPEEFKTRLKKAIEELPGQCRIIYSLKNIEGLSYSEVAEYLGVTEKTVENQINIALKKLRALLKDYKEEYYKR